MNKQGPITSETDKPADAKPLWKYPEYHAWRMARARCHNPRAQAYPSYGARGITMCERWRASFWSFLKDMGPRPAKPLEIDRIDNDKGYEPGNCRWASRSVNDRNRRSNRFVTYHGNSVLLLELCERFGAWPDTVRWRIRKGWPVERAVETPTRRKQSVRGSFANVVAQGVLDDAEVAA